jgi:hypothetical protein
MTAPQLVNMKFWIVKPKESTNQIKNPRFDPPDGVEDWTAGGAGVSLALTGDEQRRGAYSMQINTATGVASGAYHAGLTVVKDLPYTFSCDVKGVAGQAMRITITDAADAVKGTTTWTATGYWQRKEVMITAAEGVATYRVKVIRDAAASTDPFYVDGAQFEQASKATTFIHGYERGCRWTGAARNSSSYRPATTRYGGELIDISTYAKIISVHGFGNGQWNQVLTKMTSGGDMYQGHIRKSRNVSLVLAYHGDNQGDLQANRKVIIDACRPDLLEGQEMILRYQGFDANGVEATNPVDIVCVFQPSHNDTPSMPVFQKDILNFTVPSGLLDGAYNDGKELDLYANFPAEFIVKRDPQGNWCTWDTDHYDSLITGLNGMVYCMAEGPDGKIYVGGKFTDAGGVAEADYLARWNPITAAWEAVGTPAFSGSYTGMGTAVKTMAFGPDGILYVGGSFLNVQSVPAADAIAKFDGTNWSALGAGINGDVNSIKFAPNGDLYIGGYFYEAGGVSGANFITKWNGASFVALGSGLGQDVYAIDIAGNGDVYIGGNFPDASYPYLCKWNGTAFSVVGKNTDINSAVYALAISENNYLYVGGSFTNVGGVTGFNYIACLKIGSSLWTALGSGVNGVVFHLTYKSGRVYACGSFTSAGGLTLTDRVAIWSNSAWQAFDVDLPGSTTIRPILLASDGSLYIGGDFSTTGETPDENAVTGVVALNLNVSSASANTYPYMQVFGPGTLKAITNYSTGKTISFDGLTLNAGEWINLFFDPLNLKFQGGWSGRGNLMRYIVPGSDYGDFYMMPGENLISIFYPDSDPSSGSHAWIQWTPRFWGLDGALL